MDRTCIGSVCLLLVCSPGLGGVMITPVGPEGSTYFPSAMNERGDVVFRVNWGLGGVQPGEMLAGPVVVFADGTHQEYRVEGAEYGAGRAITNDGVLLGQYSFLVLEPDGIDFVSRSKSMLKEPDGAELFYTGAFDHSQFWGVTPDGTFLGSGGASEFDVFGDPESPAQPIAWAPTGGETLLEMPEGAVDGQASFWNPAGGYVGLVSDAASNFRYVWWDKSGGITGTFDVAQVFASGWPDSYSFTGIREDGAMIGSINNRLMAFGPDNTMTPIGAPFDRDVLLVDANSAGMSLGMLWDADGLGFDISSVLFDADGRAVDLQSLFPSDSPWAIADVHDITESGDILVRALRRDDQSIAQAFIIRGIPAPGAIALCAIGFAWVGSRRCR